MTALYGALRSRLLAVPAVTDIVGTTVRPVLLAPGDTTPAITLQQVSGLRERELGGDAGWAAPRWQINCLADTPLQAETLEAAVIGALNDYAGTVGGVTFEGVRYADARDLEPAELPGEPAVRHGRAVDFFVPHRA